MKKVAVLFAMKNSIYNSYPQCDVYDIARDAMTYTGDLPVIAHPPCRLWSRMRAFSTAPEEEKQTAWFALEAVRRCGGILEHPAASSLWSSANLPFGNQRDQYGGWTLSVNQIWFGHNAIKKTWLYVVGIEPSEIMPYPITFNLPNGVVAGPGNRLPHIPKWQRSATPLKFAEWLIANVELIGQTVKV